MKYWDDFTSGGDGSKVLAEQGAGINEEDPVDGGEDPTALWQSFNGRCNIQNFELCLSFYPHPNISDKFPCHFIFVEDKTNTSLSTQ